MGRALFAVLGVGLLAFILWKANLAETWTLLRTAEPVPVALGFLAACVMTWLKGVRWSLLLGLQGYRYPVSRSTVVYFVSLFLGNLTPGRMGDFVKILYLRRDLGQSPGYALASVLVDRVFDLYLLLALGCLGILLYPMDLDPNLVRAVWVFFALLLAVSLAAFHRRIGGFLLRWTFQKLVGSALKVRSNAAFEEFHRGLALLAKPGLLAAAALSAASYLVFFWGCRQFAVALGIPVGTAFLAFCVAVANIVSLTTFAGAGTREGAFVVLFALVGLSKEQALAYSLLFFFGAGVLITLAGWVFFLFYPVSLKEGDAAPPAERQNSRVR